MACIDRKAIVTVLSLLLFILAPTVVHAQNQAVTVTVDRHLNRHPISSYIYGTAYGDTASLADLNCPVNRLGGDTRYHQ